MKPFFPAVLALVAGIVLGAWQPRGELLAMRAELDELRTAGGKPCRGNAADGIRTILRAERPEGLRAERPEGVVASHPEPRAEDPPAAPDLPADDQAAPGPDVAPVDEADVAAQADAMAAALDARRAQAMAALTEQADLDDAQVASVNQLMDDMNSQLKAQVDRFVDEAVANNDVDRRDMMDFAAESLDIVIATDDAMRKTLPPEAYDDADDSAVDPLSYLSGETLDALTRLQGMPGLEE